MDLYTPAGRVGSDHATSGPLVDEVMNWDICKSDASQESDRRQIMNFIAGINEMTGLLHDATGEVLVENGFKRLSDTQLSEERTVRAQSGLLEYAHE